ncbi:AAA family ATPase, partial [Devosia sp.]|uniref:AAA family ATPase n=1 Tax=Devosia sp. TaxID=1871048 RepID=UPI00273300DC
RKFSNISITLNPQLTLIIGTNGAGKTTIADAIAKTLSWISSNFLNEDGRGKSVILSDIRVGSDFSKIHSQFTLTTKNSYSVQLYKVNIGKEKKKNSELAEIKILGNLYRTLYDKHQIDLPVFAYYSVDRIDKFGKRPTTKPITSPLDNYTNCLDGKADFSSLLEYIHYLEERIMRLTRIDPILLSNYLKLKSKVELKVKQGIFIHDDPEYIELSKLESSLLPPPKDEGAKLYFDILNSVIKTFVPDINNIRIGYADENDLVNNLQVKRPIIKVQIDDIWLEIDQLSHGQKSLLAMVTDLSRRMMMLNQKLENPLAGQGIVLIDEIELHLHPTWQQTVIGNLQKTFPNIQFIITTHSPHVLSSVDAACIRPLRDAIAPKTDNRVAQVDAIHYQTKGVSSADVLAEIMGVNPVADVPEAKMLSAYHALIQKNLHETVEGLALRRQLDDHFGNQHPVMQDCDRILRLQAFKKKWPLPSNTK